MSILKFIPNKRWALVALFVLIIFDTITLKLVTDQQHEKYIQKQQIEILKTARDGIIQNGGHKTW